ncbi:hypothetical protein Ddc_23330 [Ditylenchus destructor]|nr:hypothetical protein Ddc_23330 [Ditylenchus destructor]
MMAGILPRPNSINTGSGTEARHGLHDVEQRHQHRAQAIAACGQDTQRHADQHRDHRGDHHQGQGLHQLVPQANRTYEEQQTDDHRRGHHLAGGVPGDTADDGQHQPPGAARSNPSRLTIGPQQGVEMCRNTSP